MTRLLKVWDLLLAGAIAVCFAAWVQTDVWKDITTELIAFFSIQAAAILPAMIFTAGLLRPEGVSVPEVRQYHKALRSQMLFWIALLALDFLTAGSLIFAKAVSWTLTVTIAVLERTYDLSWLINAAIAFLGSLAICRIVPFVRGILSLLRLNSELTEKAILKRNVEEAEEKGEAASLRPFKKPEGYGRLASRE